MGAANVKGAQRRSKHHAVDAQGEIQTRESSGEIDTTECEDIINNLSIEGSPDNTPTQYDIVFHFDDFAKVASQHGCGISLGNRLQSLLWSDLQSNGWVEPAEGESAEVPEEFYSHFSLRGMRPKVLRVFRVNWFLRQLCNCRCSGTV